MSDDHAIWIAAARAHREGNRHQLAEQVGALLPPSVREMVEDCIVNPARPRKASPVVERWADAVQDHERFSAIGMGFTDAFKAVASKYKLSIREEKAFDNVLKRCRTDVNDELKRRTKS